MFLQQASYTPPFGGLGVKLKVPLHSVVLVEHGEDATPVLEHELQDALGA